MKAATRHDAPATTSRRSRPWLAAFVLVGLTGGLVLGFYLSIFPLRGITTPIGWDSSQYVWRTKLAQHVGVADTPDAAPRYVPVKKGRPAYPLLAGVVSTASGQNPFVVTALLPAVLAAAMGLAAAALVGMALRAPPAAFLFVGAVVGVAPAAVLMLQYAYLENLMVAAVFLSAAIPLVASIESRGAAVPAALLMGSIALLHGLFFAMVAATVLGAAALWVPRSWRMLRGGTLFLDTPSARLGLGAAGGIAIGAAALFGLLDGRPSPQLEAHQFAKKLRGDLPHYRLPGALPIAAFGAVALAREDRSERPGRPRALLVLLLAWSGVILGGFLVAWLTPVTVPLNRLLIFALPVPLFGALATLWAARALMRRRSRAGIVVLAVVGLAVLLGSGLQWVRTAPQTDAHKLRDAAWVAQYLDAADVPADRPVVFVVSSTDDEPQLGVDLMRDHILASFPAERMREVHMFLGTPEDYLARRPTADPSQPRYRIVSERLLGRIADTYDRDPVAVMPTAFNAGFDAWVASHPETISGGVLAILQGPPAPAELVFENPTTSLRPVPLGLLGILTLALLAAAGLGWSRALLGRWVDAAGALAVAPAIGVAVLVVTAALLDRLGVRPSGAGALAAIAIAGLGGWGLFLGRRRTA